MKEQIVLCDLRSSDSVMTTWLNKHPKLTVGAKISLKPDNGKRYIVERIYEGPDHFVDEFDWHRNWDNNI